MKNLTKPFAVLSVFTLAFVLLVAPALASDGDHVCDCDFDSGQAFSEHVKMHAQMGYLNGDMNPGVHHQGFSPWTPGN